MKMKFRMFKRTALRVKKALWRMYWNTNDCVKVHLHVRLSEVFQGVLAVALCYFLYWLSGIFA